jgi:hypothetical protein
VEAPEQAQLGRHSHTFDRQSAVCSLWHEAATDVVMSSFATTTQSEMSAEVDAWMAVASPLPESPPGKKGKLNFRK